LFSTHGYIPSGKPLRIGADGVAGTVGIPAVQKPKSNVAG